MLEERWKFVRWERCQSFHSGFVYCIRDGVRSQMALDTMAVAYDTQRYPRNSACMVLGGCSILSCNLATLEELVS